MLEPFLCGQIALASLLPKLRDHFAEFLNNTSPAGLRILSSSTCVGLRYGYIWSYSGFSRQYGFTRFATSISLPITLQLPATVLPLAYAFVLGLVFPFPARAILLCPHSSVHMQYRNLYLLSIDYASRPRLRPRLTQSRSALLWKPWIFGLKDSHLHLATHSGILSSHRSTAPSGTASPQWQCSSTNQHSLIPELR